MTALPKEMQTADKKYDENSLWWQVKRLGLLVAVDEEHFAGDVRRELSDMQQIFEKLAIQAESIAKDLAKQGKLDEAKEILSQTTESCTELLSDTVTREADRLADIVRSAGGLYGRQKETIEKYIEYSEIDLF
jgi:dipeptidase